MSGLRLAALLVLAALAGGVIWKSLPARTAPVEGLIAPERRRCDQSQQIRKPPNRNPHQSGANVACLRLFSVRFARKWFSLSSQTNPLE